MDMTEAAAVLRQQCVDDFGEAIGGSLAAMATPGFELTDAAPDRPRTGSCRFGGPALLEPGTVWPEHEGVPLSLFAVLDTGALAHWPGEHHGPGPRLLNIFYFETPDDSFRPARWSPWESWADPRVEDAKASCAVIAARPERAEEAQTPEMATVFPSTPQHAAPMLMTPDEWDDALGHLDLHAIPEFAAASEFERDYPEFFLSRHFRRGPGRLVRPDGSGEDHGPSSAIAFGWPRTMSGAYTKGGRDRPLLQLSTNDLWSWSEGGSVHIVLPGEDLAAGDYTEAAAYVDGW
ncbi:DUF1963 domain-containing protein [Nocardiopsis suaedae]|uniref:DUF1963 domain-containing protein n=1 Tax=Nocardiopsis suaedae TaxID=3018444 RepID=A0ABT4TF76_9ACTN|nr:DUF1963 domain-containing protein [Nocardiopsis suaedae]MDA2803075.1 DUF1963 domain-containing protein [Nocardiopsis suaedae]